MNRSESPPIDKKLHIILQDILNSNYPDIIERFGAPFLAGLEITSESDCCNFVPEVELLFEGYPEVNALKQISKVLYMWSSQEQFPIRFQSIDGFDTENTNQIIQNLNQFSPLIQELISKINENSDRTYHLARQVLHSLGPRGVLLCLGVRSTVGSVEKYCIPTRASLFASFNQLHTQPEEESKRNRSMLSVGSRALSKHAHRSSEGFWGNVRGSEQKKNELANEILTKILNQAVWINIHNLPHDEPVIEIRVAKGYGARWSVNNSQQFRGFLEPQMEQGHANKWRHQLIFQYQMGCAEGRPGLSPQEIKICAAEAQTHYPSIYAVSSILQIKRVSQNCELNLNQLKLAHSYILPGVNFENATLIQLKTCGLGPDVFSESNIVVLMVLLGKGTQKEKAQLIFDEYDLDVAEVLSQQSIGLMIQSLYNIAVMQLPKLVQKPDTSHISKYIDDITDAEERGKKQIQADLMKGAATIKKAAFVERFLGIEDGCLVTTYGIREYFYKKISWKVKSSTPF